MKKKGRPGLLSENRRARHFYTIEDSLECGIELKGTEVKSIKAASFSFTDAFVEVKSDELWLRNLHISAYKFGNIHNHDPVRRRRLLAHGKEIRRLKRRVQEQGYTLIPMKFYLKKGLVKVELGLCKGKTMTDKRDTVRKRDLERDMEREGRQAPKNRH